MKITKSNLRKLIREQKHSRRDLWITLHNIAPSPGIIPWAEAEHETGHSKDEIMNYIQSEADDSDLYWMDYNAEGLDLDDPMSV